MLNQEPSALSFGRFVSRTIIMPSAVVATRPQKRRSVVIKEDEEDTTTPSFENDENSDPQDPHRRIKRSRRNEDEPSSPAPMEEELEEEEVEATKIPEEAEPSEDRPAESPPAAMATPKAFRSINEPGKQAEAGIIKRVHVENFMCHRKLTIDLCRNVNFIHGQNGSGYDNAKFHSCVLFSCLFLTRLPCRFIPFSRKSAILAAIQICLGAGAKRTHRARNLMELIRKEGNATRAIVQVTLLNTGADAFRPKKYGDSITIQRTIAKSGSGYKLLNQHGKEPEELEGKPKMNPRKELDMLLDQLNIQVENPVAVLDQEEAKKFLCGKPEDKYAFFVKATELERLDKTYAAIKDNIMDMSDSCARIKMDLGPLAENVKKFEKAYKEFEILDKLEAKLSNQRCLYAWSVYVGAKQKAEEQKEVRVDLSKWLDRFSVPDFFFDVGSTDTRSLERKAI